MDSRVWNALLCQGTLREIAMPRKPDAAFVQRCTKLA